MRTLLIRWLILAVAIAIAVALVSGINVHGGIGGYILVAAALSDVLSIDNFWAAIVGALVISLVSTFLNWVLVDRRLERR